MTGAAITTVAPTRIVRRAISIAQPYAFAILIGVKRVENRTYRTNHRGPLLIHAPKREWVGDVPWVLREIAHATGKSADEIDRLYTANRNLGCVVGMVDLVDCVDGALDDPWRTGSPYAWVLDSPHRCDPFPCRGQQGFFDVAIDWMPADDELPVPLEREAN